MIRVARQPISCTSPITSVPDMMIHSPTLNGRLAYMVRPPSKLATRLWAAKPMAIPPAPPRARSPATEKPKIGRAHVCTPANNALLVCRLMLEKKKHKDEKVYDQ